MEVTINGETQQLPANLSLGELLARRDLENRRLAIELNMQVIPRSQFPHLHLQNGDRLEIVHAIGGG
ncbi:sulfur carrier protein ThiS [Pseudomonas sp. M30-35]|uniref:sulfur carrier protein ThiS n=1 Tax=Pseudomonas sp. M30-35 TaxID=1981174 RepID=UPI0015ADFD95|nr:sulfur carrier protein ThiS [Pseudomonas sp. M30-35]